MAEAWGYDDENGKRLFLPLVDLLLANSVKILQQGYPGVG
jgi:hypothetical protein